MFRHQLDRVFHVPSFKEQNPADLFLRLRVGAVGDQSGAVRATTYDAGLARAGQLAATGDGPAPLLQQPGELGIGVVDGLVVGLGAGVTRFAPGDRIGIPWLGWTCGECRFCRSGRENLCDRARFTGYTLEL